jgi:hypothetical protein
MVKPDDTTERAIGARALELFSATRNLTWQDSYYAAAFEAKFGAAQAQRALNLVSAAGCSFLYAAMAIDVTDGRAEVLVLETAPLRGKVAA